MQLELHFTQTVADATVIIIRWNLSTEHPKDPFMQLDLCSKQTVFEIAVIVINASDGIYALNVHGLRQLDRASHIVVEITVIPIHVLDGIYIHNAQGTWAATRPAPHTD